MMDAARCDGYIGLQSRVPPHRLGSGGNEGEPARDHSCLVGGDPSLILIAAASSNRVG
jgi:hypothetical protein